MNKKNLMFLPFLLSPLVTNAASQTDWSGGSSPEITTSWDARFSSSSGINWRGRAGQLSLTSTITSNITQHFISGDIQGPQGIAVGDLTGDGLDDVLTTHSTITAGVLRFDDPNSQGAIYYWHQVGGSWTRSIVTEYFFGVTVPKVIDFDGDGDLDVYAAASYGITDPKAPAPTNRNGRYAWFDNVNGDGSVFVKHEVGYGFRGANDVHAADFDGDGDMDLMGTSALTTGGLYQQASDVTWFENSDGKGSSWIQHDVDDFGSATRPYDSAIGDIDGDGDIDLLVGTFSEVHLYENNGDGSQFTKRLLTNQSYGHPAPEVADMDNDGDMDVIIASPGDSYIHWLDNVNGDGTVWSDQLIFYLFDVHNTEPVDFDGDGDLDLVVSYRPSDGRFSRSYIFENTSGDGRVWEYTEVQDFLGSANFSHAGDVNNDGQLDVVLTDSNQDTGVLELLWFDLNDFTGNGSLTSQILDGGTTPGWEIFSWKAIVPASTGLAVFARSGYDPASLPGFTMVPAGTTDLATVLDTTARYFQYRIDMTSADVSQSPIVTEIGFNITDAAPPADTMPPEDSTPPGDIAPPADTIPPAENLPPVANAGLDQTIIAREQTSLDGLGSFDPDGIIVAWQWEQVSGKSVSISNANESVASFRAPRVRRNRTRTLVFELTVTDNEGATHTDNITITVVRD